jgi:hypothetical protein
MWGHGALKFSGHFQIVVDTADPFWPEGLTMPYDDTHIHYGEGQIDVQLALEPGPHVLLLQMCNNLHQSYGEAFANKIQITVGS